MPKYRVSVCRTGFGFAEFEVEAGSEQKAKSAAMERAYDTVFSEKTSEYSIQGIMKNAKTHTHIGPSRKR